MGKIIIIIIIYKFKNFVTTLNFFKPNIIALWTKFENKLDCKLRL